jgi:hypothetical protein
MENIPRLIIMTNTKPNLNQYHAGPMCNSKSLK